MTVVVGVLTVVVLLLAVMVAGLLRSHAEILRALHDLGVNLDPDETSGHTFDVRRPPTYGAAQFETAPGIAVPNDRPLPPPMDLRGVTPDGDAIQVGILGSTEPTLLAFLSSGCGTCLEFWDGLAETDRVGGLSARLVAVTKGPDGESPGSVARLAPEQHTTIMSTEAFEDYGVTLAPYFVLVDGRSGVVGEGAASTWDQLVALLQQAADDGVVPSATRPSRRDLLSGRPRRQSVDDELAAAGIEPGDPSLYQDPR